MEEEEEGRGGRRRKAISESQENTLYYDACSLFMESAGDEGCRRKGTEGGREGLAWAVFSGEY